MRAVVQVVAGAWLTLGMTACRAEPTPAQGAASAAGVGWSVGGVGGLIGQAPGPSFGGTSGAIAGGPAAPAAGSGDRLGLAGRGVGAAGASGLGGPGPAAVPVAGSGGAAGASTAGQGGAAGAAAGSGSVELEKFSFFVTSLAGMKALSENDDGFGGDLRFGQESGLAGADKICTELAERSLVGSGRKGWRAFLSTRAGGMNGGPVHARDRIGEGPWYDRAGRLIAEDLSDLMQTRPAGADPAIVDDLPNENGIPNRQDTLPDADDNHDTVTGSNEQGMFDGTPTCDDWTSTETPMAETGAAGGGGRGGGGSRSNGPRIGHSLPARSGMAWMSAHQAPGCAPSVSLVQMGGGDGVGIGNGGGYGGIYCFALKP